MDLYSLGGTVERSKYRKQESKNKSDQKYKRVINFIFVFFLRISGHILDQITFSFLFFLFYLKKSKRNPLTALLPNRKKASISHFDFCCC